VLEENKRIRDKFSVCAHIKSQLFPPAIVKGVTTNRHVEEEELEETAHRLDDEPHNLQGPAGFTHPIATPQLHEIKSCSLQNKVPSRVPDSRSHPTSLPHVPPFLSTQQLRN